MKYRIQLYKHRQVPISGRWLIRKMKFSTWYLVHVVLAGHWWSLIIDKIEKGGLSEEGEKT